MENKEEPIEQTPKSKAAADYVNNTVFADETGDDEVLVKNMRFMAFSAGADWGAQAERAEVLRVAEELFASDEIPSYMHGDISYFLDRLKQRLAEK